MCPAQFRQARYPLLVSLPGMAGQFLPIRNIVEGQVVIQCCQVLAVLVWFPGCITKGPLYIESHLLSLPGVSHYGIDIPFFVFWGSVIVIVFCLVVGLLVVLD